MVVLHLCCYELEIDTYFPILKYNFKILNKNILLLNQEYQIND